MTPTYINLVSSDEEEEEVIVQPPLSQIIDLTQDSDEMSTASSRRSRYGRYGRCDRCDHHDRHDRHDRHNRHNRHNRHDRHNHRYDRRVKRVKQHAIQNPSQRQSVARSVARNLVFRCGECRYRFTPDNPPLSKRGPGNLCVGCSELREIVKSTGEDIEQVRRWLCTGEIEFDIWTNYIKNGREERSVASRVSQMRNRFERRRNIGRANPTHVHDLPSQEQLKQLVINNGCKCPVTGFVCHWSTWGMKSWSLTLDHIDPVSTAPPDVNPWCVSNIQVMCHLMNQIKNNHPDVEIHRWFSIWKNANT